MTTEINSICDQENRVVERVFPGDSEALRGLLNRRALISNRSNQEWWLAYGQGVSSEQSEALVWLIRDFFVGTGPDYLHNYRVHLLKEEPVPPGRKCHMRTVISSNLIASLKVAPDNPSLRAHVLAVVKQPLPPEVKTFEQIKDWIEINIDPAVVGNALPRGNDALAFEIAVSVEREVRGRLFFRGTRHGRGNYRVTDGVLLEKARYAVRNGLTMADLLENIGDYLRRMAGENLPDLSYPELYTEEDGDWESTDTRFDDDSEDADNFSWNQALLRNHVRSALQRLEPGLLEQIHDEEE